MTSTKFAVSLAEGRRVRQLPIVFIAALGLVLPAKAQPPAQNNTKVNREENSMQSIPAVSVPQSQSGAAASGVPSVAIPKTTAVLVIETPKQGVTPGQIMDVIPAEIRATVKRYLEGKIREWYSRSDGKGVIFLIDAKTEEEARAIVETLPLAKENLMDHQYIPVGPLMPLRALMGAGAQQ